MDRVYVETSVVSYLRQRPSGQLVSAARQVLTRKWWDRDRSLYELVTTQYVLDEAAQGDSQLAAARENRCPSYCRCFVSQYRILTDVELQAYR